jgi:HlyD family secretion protein
MKRTLVITGFVVVVAILFLLVFNKFTSKKDTSVLYTEVRTGDFEIDLTVTGELIAERSVEIKGPDFAQGRDIHGMDVKITDLIPEGTLVKRGDYIATLDRTNLNNTLKDEREKLLNLKTELELKLLDTAIVLNDRRDEIRNQKFIVEEAAMTLHNSKFEPPATIRQAEIDLDKSQRVLEQRERGYTRKLAQSINDIYNMNYWINKGTRRVNDIEEVLSGFTITAPASGMLIYMKDHHGERRKIGSTINPFDRVIATLPDLTSMISKTYVNEIDVSKIIPGQKVQVTIDAFSDKTFTGIVSYVANIGEKLPNTDDKVFELQIKIDGSDPLLRPSMTTGNKILINKVDNVLFIPIECVQAGVDSIPFVFTKSGHKQIVLLGESNEKNIIVKKGLKPDDILYLNNPVKPETFKLAGEDLIPVIKEQLKISRIKYGY